MSDVTAVIGIDCATQTRKVGLALARFGGRTWELEDVADPRGRRGAEEVVEQWLGSIKGRVLLALDAPLGWPEPMGKVLAEHEAGAAIAPGPNDMFRRATDRFVARVIGKTPLDVGADRIARTAHWALALLGELRRRIDEPIPLAWGVPAPARIAAIEVYPAATLLAHGVDVKGYKGKDDQEARERIVAELDGRLDLNGNKELLTMNVDALDASACVLGGLDFLEGSALPPDERELARQEGWIWVRDPSKSQDFNRLVKDRTA